MPTRRSAKQSDLPNFDSAPKDFNFDSIFTENPFSGVDRVADGHQLTAGVTTRLLDPDTGAEVLRLGVVAALPASRPAGDARRHAAARRSVSPTCCCSARRSLVPQLELRRRGAVQPRRLAAFGALDRRRALLARAVPHGERDLPPDPRPDRADRARLAMAGLSAQPSSGEPPQRGSGQFVRRHPRTRSAGSTTACRTAAHRLDRRRSSTTPAAGSAAWSPSACPPGAARRRRA